MVLYIWCTIRSRTQCDKAACSCVCSELLLAATMGQQVHAP